MSNEMQPEVRRFTPIEVISAGLNEHCDELHPKQARSLVIELEKHGYRIVHESTLITPDEDVIPGIWSNGKFERLDAEKT